MTISWWDFHLVRKFENPGGLLYGECVVSLMVVLLGVNIVISVCTTDGYKVGCWFGRIFLTVLNTELGDCECLSLYWSLVPILVCVLGGWCMHNGDGTEMSSHYLCRCCVWIFPRCITFANQTIICLMCFSFLMIPWPSWFNNNKMSLYNIICVWIVPPNIAQTDVTVNHFTQPASQHIQSPM